MENPLSQADIDALMRALLPAGGEDLFQSKGQQVRPYDFRRPTKFKKDLLRTLVMLHENFARLLQSFFLASLRIRTQTHVRNTNQYSYSEFIQLLPNPAVVATFKMDPLPGTCLLEMSTNIAYGIIDRVFGGGGVEEHPQRGLTEIEMGVVQRVISDMLSPLQEAWRNVAQVNPTLKSMETNPVFLQSTASAEVVAVITVGIEIGEHMGHITLAFPHAAVEAVLSRLSGTGLLSQELAASEEDGQKLQESLTEAQLPVSVFLGETKITVSEFTALRVGDVIPLTTRVGSDVPVYVGNRLVFYGRPGIAGKRLSVQIRRAPGVAGR